MKTLIPDILQSHNDNELGMIKNGRKNLITLKSKKKMENV